VVRVAVVLASLWPLGCGFSPGDAIDAPGDDGGGPIDADIDAVDAPAICTTWIARHFVPCAIPSPSPNDVVLAAGEYSYDTTTATLKAIDGPAIEHASMVLVQEGGIEARLISVPRFEVQAGATLTVIGNMPLIVASWNDIVIAGVVDAGSSSDPATFRVGAGARIGPCNLATPGTGAGDLAGQGGSGGGGGGGFAGMGGSGGIGDSPPIAPGGPGALAIGAPTIVRAGCGGAASGRAGANATMPPGPDAVSDGGAGGGGIQLTARVSISIDGTVASGGAGGLGAPTGTACGGGGGGSGGFVGFDSVSVSLDAGSFVVANGGGGGGTAPFTGTGVRGTDGRRDGQGAGGGPNNGCSVQVIFGGNGANGSAGVELSGAHASGNTSCGGGGGGGGAGYILYWSSGFSIQGGATVSPPAVLGP
jgi:hypothetical protein